VPGSLNPNRVWSLDSPLVELEQLHEPGLLPQSSHHKSETTMATESNQPHNQITFVGIDVSKDSLDVAAGGNHRTFKNSPTGFRDLLKWIRKSQDEAFQIICEATGGYERPLVKALLAEGVLVSVVTPARVRSLARSFGTYAKTDKIDAALLVRFGEVTRPKPLTPPDRESQNLTELVDFRRQILDQISILKNQQEHLTPGPLLRSSNRVLRTYQAELKLLEKAIDELMKANGRLWEKFQRLMQVEGVGRYTALGVLAYFHEIGSLSRKQAAALAGLAPYNNDSGNRKGSRSIHGGRTKLRGALYMAALTAAHKNPVLSPFYARLKANGKASKAALTAVMRKLIVLLNHLIKHPEFSLAS